MGLTQQPPSVPPHQATKPHHAEVCKCARSDISQFQIFTAVFSPQVVLALASAAAQAQVLLNGALPYPYAAHAAPYAAAPVAALPADYAVSAAAPVAPAPGEEIFSGAKYFHS